MPNRSSFRLLAPAFVGFALLGAALALRYLFDADEAHTRFLGRDFGAECWVRAHWHVPCPNCGLTRSLILAAHDEVRRALKLNWGGVVFYLALWFNGWTLIVFGAARALVCGSKQWVVARWARRMIVHCANFAVALWLLGWAVAFTRALATK